MNLHVIFNPAAGGGRLTPDVLRGLLGPAAVIQVSKRLGEAQALAQQAVQSGASLVAVCGGDGTIADTARGLTHSGVPLAILPGGTANILARELGVPLRLRDAAALIAAPDRRTRALDLGLIGERPFLIRASAGFEAAIINRTRAPLKQLFGPAGYALGAAQALGGRWAAHFRLVIDGQAIEAVGMNLFVANAASLARLGLRFAARVQPDDGQLDVILFRLGLGARLAGLNRRARLAQHWQGMTIDIEADPPQPVHADGELAGSTPVQARLLAGAVQVVVPPQKGENRAARDR